MSQKLTICRVGRGWAARDVTGTTYGHSTDLREAIAVAEQLANRVGGSVALSPEAEVHLRSLPKRPVG